MKRICQALLPVVCLLPGMWLTSCTSSGKQAETNQEFEEFLGLFKPLESDMAWDSIFASRQVEAIDSNAFTAPMLVPDGADITGYTLNACRMERLGDVAVTFIRRDRCSTLYMEPMDFDEIVATYSPAGELIDWAVMGAEGFAFHSKATSFTADPFELTIEQEHLTDMAQISDIGNLTFEGQACHYTIADDGKIVCAETGETWMKTYPRDRELSRSATYQEFLDCFPTWTANEVTSSILELEPSEVENSAGVGRRIAAHFLSDYVACDCMPRNILWRPCHKVLTEKYDIFLVDAECDYPVKERCQFADMILVTYTKDGEYIDHAPLYRAGDYYEHRFLAGEMTPFSITMEQTEIEGDINDPASQTVAKSVKTVTVLPDGHIRVTPA